MNVAALFVAPTTVYRTIDGVDVYDRERNALTFTGGCPVVAHPPCRSWSRRQRHQAKPEAGERELAIWAVQVLRDNGGVLEHPRRSLLWDALDLPQPGSTSSGLSTIEVDQSWFGFRTRKSTWLLTTCDRNNLPEIPFVLRNVRNDWRHYQLMSRKQRAETTRAFAEFLVEIARRSAT